MLALSPSESLARHNAAAVGLVWSRLSVANRGLCRVRAECQLGIVTPKSTRCGRGGGDMAKRKLRPSVEPLLLGGAGSVYLDDVTIWGFTDE